MTDGSSEFEATTIALKIISCVLRAKERFGAYLIAGTLCGAKNKKITEFGLDKLSTYAIVTDLNIHRVRNVIYELIREGFIMRSSEYNNLTVSLKGKQFLKTRYSLFMPKKILNVPREPLFPPNLLSTQIETLKLLEKGLTAAEIAKARGLVESTIETHLADLVYHGKINELSKLIPRDIANQIKEVISSSPNAKLTSIKGQLPPEITYGQIRLILAQTKRMG